MTRIGYLCDDTQCAGVARVPPTPDSQPESSEHDSVVRACESGVAILCTRRPSKRRGDDVVCDFLYWCKLVSEFLKHGVITLEIFR